MARFFGEVGYGSTVETAPGVWEDVITVRKYYGDVLSINRRLSGDKVNSDISVNNQISVVADAFAFQMFHTIKYVSWLGRNWTVEKVDVRAPRLIFDLGEVYNGPEGTTPNAA
ncbi:hypothetical protein SEA_LEWANDO_17 [Arthrobacter phage Lewando]|jgi:hypothetical protein|nr:hypothetical protein SEA_LEWANDO_17 [Arthrobacter phage Lewando]